jgi:citrate lyase subunit beta-like protein
MLCNCAKALLQPVLVNTSKTPFRKYTARRALMYVPASDDKKVAKAFATNADCITLDCEDGVALNKKVQARLNIRELLEKGKPARKRRYELVVRVNSIASGFIKDDLRVILTAPHLPDSIYLPKVEQIDQLKIFSDYLNEYIKKNAKLGLILGIESAVALLNVVDICKEAVKMSETSKFQPAALVFGSDDYCASIGARRSESSSEITYARQKVISVARAFNLQAIDMVYIKYQDLKGLKKQAEEGARWGFTGKQIIHPGQIDVTQEAFSPTSAEIEWASGVLKAFHKHQKEGEGAFAYKGNMIDMPTMKQAQNIMDLSNAIMIEK